MRVFAGSLQTETNTFSPFPTVDRDFLDLTFRAGEHPEAPTLYTAPLWVARRECRARGWTLAEGLCAGAHPAGVIAQATWEHLRDELLADLRRALPVHIVLLGLHGAMVAEACHDCEGDLLNRVRALVGPDAVVAATLDPHAHLSSAMLASSDILIAFKEYPHTDSLARAEELWALALGAATGRVKPTVAVHDCRMIDMIFTLQEPAAGLVRRMTEMENREGVLSVSLIHGFPWGDVADFGAKALVVTDNAPDLARSVAAELSAALNAIRGATRSALTTIAEALEQARRPARPPLVLADFADNPGAGCPGDSTWLIGALIEGGVRDAAAGLIYDPMAVEIAKAAGPGARMPMRIGGKMCAFSGQPLDLDVEVLNVTSDAVYDVKVLQIPLGDVATVRVADSFDLVLTSKRSQCFSPNAFTDFGVDLSRKSVIVVKSMQHFQAGFQRMAGSVLYVDSPGAANLDVVSLPYRHVDRSIWPFTTA
jgi:microcystin degradation protein MlrC